MMPMTKAERAELAAWKQRAALAWPTFERPEPISAAEMDVAVGRIASVFHGWWVNINRGVGGCVGVGTVVNSGHATTFYNAEQIANRYNGGSMVSLSQGRGGPWFRDQEDALKEAAWRLAERYAGELDALYDRVRAEQP
jgi:hypothetical protein